MSAPFDGMHLYTNASQQSADTLNKDVDEYIQFAFLFFGLL